VVQVRLLMDHTGKRIKSAGPSVPVQVVGFDGVPGAGDMFIVVDKEETARTITESRRKILRESNVRGAVTSCMRVLMRVLMCVCVGV
jgi:translation initiation factor IF-2